MKEIERRKSERERGKKNRERDKEREKERERQKERKKSEIPKFHLILEGKRMGGASYQF